MKKFTLYSLIFTLLFACNGGEDIVQVRLGVHPPTAESKATATRVIEYHPAPGQFIGEEITGFTGEERNTKSVIMYAENRLKEGGIISLGGFGGYIIVAFDHSVEAWGNKSGDFTIVGNQFDGSSEPGIVWIMSDDNGNHLPDDGQWYELMGETQTTKKYSVTYYRTEPVTWSDSEGATGIIERVAVHRQASYYPQWILHNEYTLTGSLIEDRSFIEDSGEFNTGNYGWGYVDNSGSDVSSNGRTRFFISNAVDSRGEAVNLVAIDFIKIQTGVNIQGDKGIGELSTELSQIRDENI